MNNPETSNFDLERIASKIGLELNIICSKDELQNYLQAAKQQLKQKKFLTCIINLADSTQPGTHWVALYCNMQAGNLQAWYMDSYGVVPPLEIEVFCEALSPSSSYYNSKQIQSMRQGHCGQFCIVFLKFMSASSNKLNQFKKFQNLFCSVS